MRKRGAFRSAVFLLIMYHYSVIYRFSASNAVESTRQSDSVVQRVLTAVSVFLGISETGTFAANAEFIVRKLAHFTIFFILGFLIIMLTEVDLNFDFGACAAKALLCGLMGAAFDEWHQYFVPGRSAEVRDVCIDFLGVLTGCTFYGVLRRIFHSGFGGFEL